MATSIPASVDGLLAAVWNARGTDLLLTVDSAPLIRVNGHLAPLEGHPALTEDETAAAAESLLSRQQRDSFAAGHELDFSFSWRDHARIRGNVYRQRGAVAIAMRVIPRAIPTLQMLGVPPAVQRFSTLQQGLVFVTGPTGSGKSTTLAAIIAQINATRRCHIVTVEDPIEYLHEHCLAAVSQREVGSDTASFPDALRAALREDPDVILVGEVRDLESIRFCLTLAETGHLVLATLHTNDTAQAIDRLIDVFPGDQQPQVRVQLAATLTGVVYQRLVPRIGGGMVAAHEVLVGTTPVRNLIKEAKTAQLRNQIITGLTDGMQTLEMSLSALVRAGTVTYDEAVARSLHPREVDEF